MVDDFYEVHRKVYGHAFRDQSCEMVTLRLIATAVVETMALPRLEAGGRHNPGDAVLYTRRTVFDDGEARETPRYLRGTLAPTT